MERLFSYIDDKQVIGISRSFKAPSPSQSEGQ
jgi:hypothetical protein